MTAERAPAAAEAAEVVLTLLADPDLPADIAQDLAEELPPLLAERISDRVTWRVHVVSEPLLAEEQGSVHHLVRTLRERMTKEGWDYLVVLTDLPRRAGIRPIVAEVSAADRVALASLPTLGALPLRRRARRLVLELVEELTAEDLGADIRRESPRRAAQRLTELTRAVRRLQDVDDAIGVRFVALGARGHLRLLAGMVRANRPWRLVVGLSKALAAAFAAGALGLVTNTVWQLGDRLGVAKLTVTAFASIAAMVIWLIADHELWERPKGREARERAILYNAATTLTMVLGVSCLYAALFVLLSLSATFLIDPGLLRENLGHPVDWRDYLPLAWMCTSMATVGGALGSGLEDDSAVRAAAYGARQRQRRNLPSSD
jgi:hypothetical protein